MNTIRANVSRRLLSKASRLFTGSLRGRVIEILQNARRAGATRVEITNQKGDVKVHDNGRGIDDFSRLLDLGGSGWDEELEGSEDPAGVGLFCLAPREVTVRSNGHLAVIPKGGWTGDPVEIRDDRTPIQGTEFRFQDEPWSMEAVEAYAVFTGMQVVVDGKTCKQEPFIRGHCSHHPELGCRIKVTETEDVLRWHRAAAYSREFDTDVCVNFHGQVVTCRYYQMISHHMRYLVDLTGEPTGIRLVLPARTGLVENEALASLKAVLERESYLYLKRKGKHQLKYEEYQRGLALGIDLPEAEPDYRVGLLTTGDWPDTPRSCL